MTRQRTLTPSLFLSKCTDLVRTRELPVSGNIYVKKGDFVSSEQVIGEAFLEGELVIVRAAERLGVNPEEVIKGLKAKEGEEVKVDTPLCEIRSLFGLLKSSATSPVVGTVELISKETGHIGIRLPQKNLTLKSYVSGEVLQIENNRSVTIRSCCAIVQGIFGIGGEQTGVIFDLGITNNGIVNAKDIPENCKGKILIGGASATTEALLKSRDAGAVGFVVGSLKDEPLRKFLGYDIGIPLTGNEDIDMSVVITEGFGFLPMASQTHSILKSLDSWTGAINGTTQIRAGAIRPEVLAFYEAKTSEVAKVLKNEDIELKEGVVVRIVRAPYFGEIGKVESLPTETRRIDSGTMTRVVNIKLDKQIVCVPRANIEIIGGD